MLSYKKFSKIDIVNICFVSLIFELFIFFITKNYINEKILIFHIIIIVGLIVFFTINIDLSNIKRKLSSLKYLFTCLLVLIFLYARKIHYSEHLNQTLTCKKINLIFSNFLDCSYTIFFCLIIFVFFFLLFYFNKFKINLIKVFSYLGLILAIIAFYNIIFYYLNYFDIVKNNYLFNIIPFRGNYSFYFQFLPFAIDGKRNDEILIFSLAYICYFYFYINREKDKSPYYIYLFFIICFLTYSKNIWIEVILITFCLFIYFPQKKFEIIKIFGKSIIFLILTLLIINFIQVKIDTFTLKGENPKKHYISLINYTLIKFNFKFSHEKKKIITSDLDKDKLRNLKNNFMDENYYFNSTPERIIIYKNIINKLNINNFFLGNGLNSINFEIVNLDNKKKIFKIVNSESGLLQILFEIGLVGLFFYLFIIFNLMKLITAEGKVIFLSLLFLTIFNSYQESIFYFILLGSILGSSSITNVKIK
jgi:hypothetical protein